MLARLALAATAAVLLTASPSGARQTSGDSAALVEEVVVTARRSGIPVWKVGSGQSAVVLVGSIGALPKGMTWRSDELETAVGQARRVYTSVEAKGTAADLFRLTFKRGRYTDLPRGESLDGVIDPATSARLAQYAAAGLLPKTYNRHRPWFLAMKLRDGLDQTAGVSRGDSAAQAVARAAGRSGASIRPVLRVKANDVLRTVAESRPGDRACLQATADAVDQGADGVRRRAEAWTTAKVAVVAASPLSRAEQSCWPETDPALAARLRQAWRDVVRQELTEPGVVVGVVPLRWLTEPGGVLDALETDGHAISGPAWRSDG